MGRQAGGRVGGLVGVPLFCLTLGFLLLKNITVKRYSLSTGDP